MKKRWAEFVDLAPKGESEDVQFVIRAIKLHAEAMDSRLAAIEAIANVSAKRPTK